MKNYRLLVVVFFASILSGCSLGKAVTGIVLLPVSIATSVVDGVTGTKMTRSLDSAYDEAFKPGKKMDSQAMKKEFSGSTFYAVPYITFLKDNGTALSRKKKSDTIEEVKWTTSTGQLCIEKDCYEIRVNDKELLINSAYYKKGDTESLNTKMEAQIKQEAEKQAEAERKKAEEKAARERKEARQKLAMQKAEEEERRCMANSKCRANFDPVSNLVKKKILEYASRNDMVMVVFKAKGNVDATLGNIKTAMHTRDPGGFFNPYWIVDFPDEAVSSKTNCGVVIGQWYSSGFPVRGSWESIMKKAFQEYTEVGTYFYTQDGGFRETTDFNVKPVKKICLSNLDL